VGERDTENRLSALKSHISKLNQLFLTKAKTLIKSKMNWLGRIRTSDLRHVKTGVLALVLAFSDFFALFFVSARCTLRLFRLNVYYDGKLAEWR